MSLKKRLRSIYNTAATKIYTLTSKRAVMDLAELFDTPTMTKYHHIISALRYVAVEHYYGENDFGRDLYIKANRWESDADLQADLGRFDALIKSIEVDGYDSRSRIFVDLDKNCFNGTHRLALCVWFGVEKIPVYLVKRRLQQPTVEQMKVYYQLSEQDALRLEEAYQRMYARLHKN